MHWSEANAFGHFLRALFERDGRLRGRLPVRVGCSTTGLGLEGCREEGYFLSIRFMLETSTVCFGSFL